MSKRQEKIFVLAAAAIVVVALFYFPISESYLGFLLKPFEDPDWETIPPKYIVKNSLIISLIESGGENCKLSAKGLNNIVGHQFFIQADDFSSKVNYEKNSETIELPCRVLPKDESRLHVWYVTEDSPVFSNIYKYNVSPLSEAITSVQNFEEETIDNKTMFDGDHDKNIPIENQYVNQILSQCGTDEICAIQILQELSKTETTR